MGKLDQLFKQLKTSPAAPEEVVESILQAAAPLLLEHIGYATIVTDELGRVIYVNPAAEQHLGWSLVDADGQPVAKIVRMLNQATGLPMANPIRNVLVQGRMISLPSQVAMLRRNGQLISIEGSAAPIFGENGRRLGVILMFHDVSKNRELAQNLIRQATHDSLTGLVNRSEFLRRAERALRSARSQNLKHAMCFMDLDQFKIVNDTCGHAAGDELLRRIATLLQSQLRQRDTLARLGGDEFGVLLENCPIDEAERVANEMLNSIKGFRFDWDGKKLSIGVSIGVAAITAESKDVTSVLGTADSACYTAKDKGRSRVQSFRSDDREFTEKQGETRLAARINAALEENRFALFFQPIAALKGKIALGEYGEILVRMITPEKQLVPPERFIPAAERYNLMPLVDRWVIKNTLASFSKIFIDEAERLRNTWAINISGTSLGSTGFVEFIREQCALYQVPAQAICFEISEISANAKVSAVADFVWALKVEGFRFALDDFGRGMNSFTNLKSLPVHYLKIYGDFIKDIVSDKISLGVVDAINRMGHIVGVETIAQHVESEAIKEKLKAIGINYAQGFAVGKPAPLRLHPKGNQLNTFSMSPNPPSPPRR